MNKSVYFLAAALVCLTAIFSGCDKHPENRLINPTENNTTGTWSPDWALYDDELRTNGTIMSYTTPEGQVLDFMSTERPRTGLRCIKFAWDGQSTTEYASPGVLQHGYVGFGLIVANQTQNYLQESKNLTGAGYTTISFWARGSLNSHVYLRLEGYNGSRTSISGFDAWQSNSSDRVIDDQWRQYSFTLTGSAAAVREYVKILLVYNDNGTAIPVRGNGGTVFIDDLHIKI